MFGLSYKSLNVTNPPKIETKNKVATCNRFSQTLPRDQETTNNSAHWIQWYCSYKATSISDWVGNLPVTVGWQTSPRRQRFGNTCCSYESHSSNAQHSQTWLWGQVGPTTQQYRKICLWLHYLQKIEQTFHFCTPAFRTTFILDNNCRNVGEV